VTAEHTAGPGGILRHTDLETLPPSLKASLTLSLKVRLSLEGLSLRLKSSKQWIL